MSFDDAHPGEQHAADEPDDEADAAEEVEGPGRVGGEELDRHEVEEAPPEAGPPELRRAVPALVVLDVELADAEAVPHGEHRDVAVQLAVHLEGVGQLAGHRLEPAVEVLARHAGDLGGHAVVELRRGALDEPVVADGPAAGHAVEALRLEVVEQAGHLLGVVLTVGVHEHDELARDVLEAEAQRRPTCRRCGAAGCSGRWGCAAAA